jgi:hypothetical protein
MKHLFQSIKLIIESYKEKEKLRGEHFNVFSILGVEHKENSTHSAFLSEIT